MRVDNSYLNLSPRPAESEKAAAGVQGGATSGASLQQASAHVPSQELVSLVKLAHQAPEVRGEAMHQVAMRLASGMYLSRDVAEKVAAAILRAR